MYFGNFIKSTRIELGIEFFVSFYFFKKIISLIYKNTYSMVFLINKIKFLY